MKALESIAQKEVSRKEFLTIAAFGVASLFGMGTLIKLLTGKSSSTRFKHLVNGYGSSDYGSKNN